MPSEPSPDTVLRMVALAGGFLLLFGVAELARREARAAGDVTRVFVHVGSGLLALTVPLLFDQAWPVVLLGIGFVGLMIVTRRLGLLRSIHDVGRPTAGAVLYPIGVVCAFLLSDGTGPAYPIAILTLALGDSAGAVLGRRFGSRAFGPDDSRRTAEGSIAVFAVATGVAFAVMLIGGTSLGPAAGVAAVTGLVVGVVEAISPWGLDNLTIPVVVVGLFSFALQPWLS